MRRFRSQIGVRRVLGFIVLAIVGIFVFGSVVMMLWNALLPELFHFPMISFWQALGLLVLAKILFGNFRGGGGPGRRWRRKMEVDFANMTPEQKEKIRQEWGRRCGRGFERGASSPDAPPDTSKQD